MVKKRMKCKEQIENENIALYLNMAATSPLLELHIAQIEDLLSRNNKVTIYVCDKSISSCTSNPFKSNLVCHFCKKRVQTHIIDKYNLTVKYIPQSFSYIEDSSIKVDSYLDDILETSIMSTISDIARIKDKEELNDRWENIFNSMKKDSYFLYRYFIHEFSRNKYSYLFTINGRFSCTKAVVEASKNSGLSFGLYDLKRSLHEITFIDNLIHSNFGNSQKALYSYCIDKKKAWENGREFFDKKFNNVSTGDPVFTKEQEKGLLPERLINISKKIIAIYPTTDDEYKFIGKEWDGFVPEDQVNEIKDLATNIGDEYIIVVKMHPNQKSLLPKDINRYKDIEKNFANVIVELPQSKVDTYELANVSNIVITFASTIGVETCFLRKVVILIGTTNYSSLNVAYQTYSGKEAANLIVSKNLKPKPIKGAIIWGNYLGYYSDKLPAFKKEDTGIYTINGSVLQDSPFLRILTLPAKLKIEVLRPGFKVNLSLFKRAFYSIINSFSGKWNERR